MKRVADMISGGRNMIASVYLIRNLSKLVLQRYSTVVFLRGENSVCVLSSWAVGVISASFDISIVQFLALPPTPFHPLT
jgi:hypothetical protein